MTNKEILLSALRYEEPPRVPWVPYVGVHGAYLIGKDADEFLQSADLIYQGVCKAKEEYNPDGLPIVFDLQLEAEALGCELKWAKDNPPSVIGHVLNDVPLSELKVPTEKDGRIPVVMEATERLVKEFKDEIALLGLICGPFTLGLHLMGSKMISKMVKNPDEVAEVFEFCSQVCKAMAEMYLKRGVEVIAIVDPMTSQISPQMFDKFVLNSYNPTTELVRQYNGRSLLFVCGDATRVVPNLCKVDTDGFAFDENIDMAYAAEEARKHRKVFCGNLPLTVGLLFGEVEDNIKFAQDCINIGRGPGFVLAPGCDLPYHCSVENMKAVVNLVHQG